MMAFDVCGEQKESQAITLPLEKLAHMYRLPKLSISIQELKSQLLSLRTVMLSNTIFIKSKNGCQKT
jgi:hypothetical protein